MDTGMNDYDKSIVEYLSCYAGSLTEFDAHAAADLWSTPGMIVDDETSGVVESREAMVTGLEHAYPLYRRLGLDSVSFELLRCEQLSDALALVYVRWLFKDAEGELLTDSKSYYILRRTEDGLRACVCIETDAARKLQALAAERGVDLSPA